MKKIAVFCSGYGSNLQAIINAVKRGRINAEIGLVLSDRVDAFALVRARRAGIPVLFADPVALPDREEFARYVCRQLTARKIDFVVLAGFMRILAPYLIRRFRNRIINIHPSLLPCFKGAHGIREALSHGVKVTGVTVHFVDEICDNGPIISQGSLKIKEDDCEQSLAKRIHKLEHRLYPEAISLLLEERLRVKGRKVYIDG